MIRRFLVVLALLAACSRGGPARPRPASEPLDDVWPLVNGENLELANMRGSVVVIHIFATWSLGAEADLDELRAAMNAHPHAVRLVSLGLDADGPALLLPWRDAVGADWTIAMPSAAVRAGQTPLGDVMAQVPRTVVLDGLGRIVWDHPGPLPAGLLVRVVDDVMKRKLPPGRGGQ
jgi:hypothetical protein